MDSFSFISPSNTVRYDREHENKYEEFELPKELESMSEKEQIEITLHQKAILLLNEGEKYLHFLYTCRALSPLLPQKDEIDHMANFHFLLPKMKSLLNLSDFVQRLISFISKEVFHHFLFSHSSYSSFIKSKKKKNNIKLPNLNSTQLDLITKLFNLLIDLDVLKDMKSCLLNDFSSFKRCFSLCECTDFFGKDQMYKLQIFLCDPSGLKLKILSLLLRSLFKEGDLGKSELEVKGIQTFLLQILIGLSGDKKKKEKKVMALLVVLIDSNKMYSFNEGGRARTEKREVFEEELEEFQKVLLEEERVVLFQEMSFDLEYILSSSPYFVISREGTKKKGVEVDVDVKNVEDKFRLVFKNVKEVLEKAPLSGNKVDQQLVFRCTKAVLDSVRFMEELQDIARKLVNKSLAVSLKQVVCWSKTLSRQIVDNFGFINSCLRMFMYNQVRKFPTTILEKLISSLSIKQSTKKTLLTTLTLKRRDTAAQLEQKNKLLNHCFVMKEYFAKFLKTKVLEIKDYVTLKVLVEELLFLYFNTSTVLLRKEELGLVDKFLYRLFLFSEKLHDVREYCFRLSDFSYLYFTEFSYSFDGSSNNKMEEMLLPSKKEEEEKSVVELSSLYVLDILNDSTKWCKTFHSSVLMEELTSKSAYYLTSVMNKMAHLIFTHFKYENSMSMKTHMEAVKKEKEISIELDEKWKNKSVKENLLVKRKMVQVLSCVENIVLLEKAVNVRQILRQQLLKEIEKEVEQWLKKFNSEGLDNLEHLCIIELNILRSTVFALEGYIDLVGEEIEQDERSGCFDQIFRRMTNGYVLVKKRISSEIINRLLLCSEVNMFEINDDLSKVLKRFDEDFSLRMNLCRQLCEDLEENEHIIYEQSLKEIVKVLSLNLPNFENVNVSTTNSNILLLTLKTVLEGWLFGNDQVLNLVFNFCKVLQVIGNSTLLRLQLNSKTFRREKGKREKNRDNEDRFKEQLSHCFSILELTLCMKEQVFGENSGEVLLAKVGDGVYFGGVYLNHIHGRRQRIDERNDFCSLLMRLKKSEEVFVPKTSSVCSSTTSTVVFNKIERMYKVEERGLELLMENEVTKLMKREVVYHVTLGGCGSIRQDKEEESDRVVVDMEDEEKVFMV